MRPSIRRDVKIAVEIGGFTLVELSIVLVIIGLIIGGVLVGRDLIDAAAIRAQISQIEKYQTAVNTFYGKFGYLPGDLPQAAASQIGFTVAATRAGGGGLGNGNGIIEGYWWGNNPVNGLMDGESAWFWEDLSSNSQLIPGAFNFAGAAAYVTAPVNQILPEAKLGGGNYVYVYSNNAGTTAVNYFGVSNTGSSLGPDGEINGGTSPGLSVAQAYALDKKIDDGLPQSGRVTASYMNWTLSSTLGYFNGVWAAGGNAAGASTGAPNYGPTNASTPASATTCYDNASGSGPQQYSMGQNNGAGQNCALSFRFQ